MSTNGRNGHRYESALVLGLGASGVAAADLLMGEGADVTAVDAGDDAALRRSADKLKAAGAKVVLGCGKLPQGKFSVGVISPGIDSASEWGHCMEKRGIPVLPEFELGWSRCRCRILAVTGSNGKSTLVKLCRESLVKAGCRAEPAGNYGIPLCTAARMSAQLDWLVVEISSFQMETAQCFRPDVGVLLNILPNHLDRHPDMETYSALKRKMFARMKAGDTAVVPPEQAGAIAALPRFAGRIVTFGATAAAAYAYAGSRVSAAGGGSVSLAGTIFDNEVLGLSAAAAVGAIEACGVAPSCVQAAAAAFQPLPHRMQEIAERDGVMFIDDSKATNIAAMSAALRLAKKPVRLIAGGLLKETDLRMAKEALGRKAVAVYLIGASAAAMEQAWGDTVPCRTCGDLGRAVKAAWSDAQPGEIILLSPGCASFDQFDSFEERGQRFAGFVRALGGRRCETACAAV